MTDEQLECHLKARGRLMDALYPPLNKTFRQNLEDLKLEVEREEQLKLDDIRRLFYQKPV
jgi:hypothetical protein